MEVAERDTDCDAEGSSSAPRGRAVTARLLGKSGEGNCRQVVSLLAVGFFPQMRLMNLH